MEHGLSLHISLDDGRQILFDMGQRRLFAENAARLGVNLTDVEFAVVSHGHYDHGGGLHTFLELNRHAKVYLNRHAFEPHYSLREDGLKYIGLSPELKGHDRLVACGDAETRIARDIILFAGVKSDSLKPPGNRLLFGPDQDSNDDFCHEQSLIIQEHGHAVLFAGCAHCGIVNIMQKAEAAISRPLTHVFAGMHLVKSGLTEEAETAFIRALAGILQCIIVIGIRCHQNLFVYFYIRSAVLAVISLAKFCTAIITSHEKPLYLSCHCACDLPVICSAALIPAAFPA